MAYYPLGENLEKLPDWLQKNVEDMRSLNAEQPERGNELPVWFLGEPNDFSVPAAYRLKMGPGYTLIRHGHPCWRFEVIVQGTLDAGDGIIAGVGDSFTAMPGELYGPHTAGPEGCTTFEMFGSLDGMYRMLYEGPDGTVMEADTRKGEFPPGLVFEGMGG